MIRNSSLPIRKACKALEIGKTSFYRWNSNESPLNKDLGLLQEIRTITLEFRKYGYRRVTKELHRRNKIVNHKRIHRIMKENNLLVRRKKFRPITTNSNHGLPVYPNLTRGIIVTGLNQVWVADITYVHLGKEFIYLAVILDLFSRKCIGWALDRIIDAQLTLEALNMAISERQHLGFAGLIHHSDRGVQYAAMAYVKRLKEIGIEISMSGKGNAYDNAYAESFMKTFKVEEVYINEYETFEQAYQNIWDFIERVYNEKRLHSSIGYIPPNEFEQKYLNVEVA